MGVKLSVIGYPLPVYLAFHCPGCGSDHSIRTVNAKGPGPTWDWNGSIERPTFNPSVRVSGGGVCHFFVRNGRIEYCPDSTHALKAQTVDLPDWEDKMDETNETKESQTPAAAGEQSAAHLDAALNPRTPGPAPVPRELAPTKESQNVAPGVSDLIAEAVDWVKSKGYEAAAAISIVAEHGFRKILRDKAEETGSPAAKPATPSTTHAAACGDVGETGNHGDLGTNAVDYQPEPPAETKAKSA